MEGIVAKFRDRARDTLKSRNLKCRPGAGLTGAARELNMYVNAANGGPRWYSTTSTVPGRAKANGSLRTSTS